MYNSQAVIGYPTRTSEKVWRTEIGVATCEAAGDSVPNWAENIKGLAHRSVIWIKMFIKIAHLSFLHSSLWLDPWYFTVLAWLQLTICLLSFFKKIFSKFSLVWWLLILWCGTRRMLYRQENIYIWRLLQCIYTRWDQM